MSSTKRIRWTNVKVSIETQSGQELEIKKFTVNGSEVSVETSGTTVQAGRFIQITETNLHTVLDGVYKVGPARAGGFVLLGLDGLTLDADDVQGAKGKFKELEFDADFRTVQSVSASGGEFETEDITTIHDSKRKVENTLSTAEGYTFTNFFDPDDPGYIECRRATRTKTNRAVLFTFPNRVQLVFVASVGAGGLPTGEAHQSAKVSVTLSLQGDPTILAAATAKEPVKPEPKPAQP